MSGNQSVRYGIDLGTTNSSIAILRDNDVFVVPNKFNVDITPSVVRFAVKGGQIHATEVGENARQQLKISGAGRGVQRFKREMGEPNWRFTVLGTDHSASAADLSALVLRELIESLKRTPGLPELHGAVITVPAIFQTPARNDTLRAGEAAGIGYVQLLPEPEAAALAYGHKAGSKGNQVWLVYDLGGGTFDAALVRGEDGVFTKIDTDGNRDLGGSDLDSLIVHELMIPQLPPQLRQAALPGGTMGPSELWWQMIHIAEAAKIELDVAPETRPEGNFMGVDVEFHLRKADVDAVQARLFADTLDICRRLLERNRFAPRQVERVILVGGPTRSPFLRAMIEHGLDRGDGKSRLRGLGIPLDASIDPMTAVAQGAALYAASLRMPSPPRDASQAGAKQVSIDASMPTQVLPDDVDLVVAGRVHTGSSGLEVNDKWSVVIERLEGDKGEGWQSEPIALKGNGAFTRLVTLQAGQNSFQVRVLDAQRRAVDVDETARFEVTRGYQVPPLTLDRGLGIGSVEGRTDWFFRKGDPLGGEPRTVVFKTTVALTKGGSKEIVIPLVEGFEERTNLNNVVHSLRIAYASGRQEIPVGAEIQITLAVDRNQTISMAAAFVDYAVPISPQHVQFASEDVDVRAKLELVKANMPLFSEVRKQSKDIDQVVAHIEENEVVAQVETLLRHGSAREPGAWRKARDAVLTMLKAQQPHLDKVDGLLSWDKVKGKCERNVHIIQGLAADAGDLGRDWQREFAELCRRFEEAVAKQDRTNAALLAFRLIPDHACKHEVLRAYMNEDGGDPLEGVEKRQTQKPPEADTTVTPK
jgi:molecular chaperone DnaK